MLDMIPAAIFDASQFFQWFVENANYLFVFVFMTIESSFIPFPSEVVVPPAAYLACQDGNPMNIYVVCIVATLGAITGGVVNYYLSLWIGRPIVYKFANSQLGHICLINQAKVERAEIYFDKHGAISTFIGRLIPAIRQLISIPAGLAKMNIGVFIIFTGLGSLLWNAILTILGWWLAQHVTLNELYTKVEEYNDYLTYAGIGIGVICVLYIVYRAINSPSTLKNSTHDQDPI